jgi:predicted CXXCH cytochrome family protein
VRRRTRGILAGMWIMLGLVAWTIAAVHAATGPGEPRGFVRPVVENSQAVASGAGLQAAPECVGADICVACHETQPRTYVGTPHARATDPRSPAGQRGCESCHGPGGHHITDPTEIPVPVSFANTPPDEVNATCTTCHDRGEHALWNGSSHEARDLSCTSCHSAHGFQSPGAQLKADSQMATCASCHRDKVAKFDRSGRVTCHSSIHGSNHPSGQRFTR